MRCVAISDTHGMFESITVPEGDVLIHAGDILGRGTLYELAKFDEWLSVQQHKHKIVIAGNHHWCFSEDRAASEKMLGNAIYLEDSSIVIEGIKFFGSPWQPEFYNWAFNLPRGKALQEKWALIESDTDVLITHGPPHGILDYVASGGNVGCEELLIATKKIAPKFHVFGHIHEGYGVKTQEKTTFINASINNERYNPTNDAIVFDV
ncbi:metallophosphoesterase [Oleiphilus sp. HI0009]|nr:metallophosphoesterase [Oleiphilus sp. HI0009]